MPTPRLVTVVVPVHDDPTGVRRCLEHLGRQDYPLSRLQVLVCDNASQPPLDDAIAAAVPGLSVTVLREPLPGSYRARNRCLAEAVGEVVAFTDADCSPAPDWITRGLAALDAEGADLAAGRVEVYSISRRPGPIELYDRVTAFPQEMYVRHLGFGVTANLIVNTAVFDRVGQFDDRLTSGGDREFCERAGASGCRLVYAADAVVGHPARSTFREVSEKIHRVRRGAYQERGRALPVRKVLRRAVPPLGVLGRARQSYDTPGLQVRYALGELVVHYTKFVAELRHLGRRRTGGGRRSRLRR